jgi:hypothetical protein
MLVNVKNAFYSETFQTKVVLNDQIWGKNFSKKFQDGRHFRYSHISAFIRAREKLFKQKVSQMTRYGQIKFQKNSKMAATSGLAIFRLLCVLEKNFSNEKCPK